MPIKKNVLISGLAVSSLLVANVLPALAQDQTDDYQTKKLLEEETAIIEPGVLPNSFWYWADIFSEEIEYLLKMSKESKGDFLIGIAEERLAEMKKLSEMGINKYADKLIAKHESAIKKAEDLLREAKVKGFEQLEEGQADLEKEILLKEIELKKQAKAAPGEYEKSRDQAIGNVVSGFKKILSHLSWKRLQIKDKKAEIVE